MTSPTSKSATLNSWVNVGGSGTLALTGVASGNNAQTTVTATSGYVKISTTANLTAPTGYTTAQWTANNSTEISFVGSQSAINDALNSLQFYATARSPQPKVSVMSFELGATTVAYWSPPSGNGRFYEVVDAGSTITWEQARCIAKYASRTYGGGTSNLSSDGCTGADGTRRKLNGLSGYLANITSEAEHQFLKEKTNQVGWIGGTDKDTEGVYRWMDGPEAGQVFYRANGSRRGVYSVLQADNTTSLSMFNYFSDGEPNDWNGGEDLVEFGFGTNGTIGASWNDCTNTCNRTRYIIEYGETGETLTGAANADITMTVSPDAPTGVAATAGNGQATVSWTAPAVNGGSAITSYTVTSSGGQQCTWTTGPLQCTVTGLTNATSYTFTVTATNAIGTGPASTASSAVTPFTTPGTPTGLTATPIDGGARLSWIAPANNGSAITAYSVQYSTDGTSWTTATIGTTNPYDLTGLTACVDYHFRIAATNAAGSSSYSSSVRALTFGISYPTAYASSAFTLGGSPNVATDSSGTISLTAATTGQFGSIWNKSRVDLSQNLCVAAEVYLGNSDAGADGLAFVVQPNSTAAGTSGGGLGYAGITPSLAVEFDTYVNSPEPNADHISLMKNGDTTTHNAWGVDPVSTIDLENGAWRKAQFVWNARLKTFTVRYDLTATPNNVFTDSGDVPFNAVSLDLPAHFSTSNGNVYWGFTAATGGAVNPQQVRAISYTSTSRTNVAPTMNALADQSVRPGTGSRTVTLTLTDDSTSQSQWSFFTSTSNSSVATVSTASAISETSASFTFTPGSTTGTSTITVTATDADGASVTRTFVVTNDATAPTISSFSSTTADGSYRATQDINITATASESVQAGNSITATLNTGATVTLTAASAGTTLTGTYTISAGQNTSDLTVSSYTYTAGAVLDLAGNAMTSTTVPTGSNNIAGSKAIVIDTVAPTISSFSSTTADGSYTTNQTVNITATASETLQSGSSITVTLDTGATVVVSTVSASTSLTGTYTVAAGQNSADLTVSSYAYSAGSILDVAGNAMTSTTVPTGTNNIAGADAIVIDTIGPAAPTGLSATATTNAVTISFTPGVGGPSAVTNYKYSLNGGAFTAFSPADTTSPVTISGLTSGTSYTIVLRTVTALGDSASSGSITITPYNITGLSTVSYTEQDPATSIASSVSFSGGSSYDGKYIDFAIGSPQVTEILGYTTSGSASTTNGAVSIVGTAVYLGNGTSADPIGSIDATRNGQNGQPLRINFVNSFSNASFENATLTGWTPLEQQVVLGSTNIAGYVAIDRRNYTAMACANDYDDGVYTGSSVNWTRKTVSLTTSTASVGSKSLLLDMYAVAGSGGGWVIHGPAVYSDNFEASANDVISFDWKAVGGGDDYSVFGYILNTSTGAQTTVLDAYEKRDGLIPNWTTASVTIPTTGTYKFVFVAGSHNADCGSQGDAKLYIDNVQVFGSKVNDSVASKVARLVTYRNTSDAPSASRTVTVTTNPTGGTFTTTFSIAVTRVDDAPALTSVSTAYTNTSAVDTFTAASGTLPGSDPDGDTLTYSLPDGATGSATYGSVTYDRFETGTYGTLWLKSATGQYYFAPDNTAINNRLTNDSEAFSTRVTAAGVDANSTLTVSVAITAAAPAAPTGLNVTAGVRALNVSWTAPTWIGGSAVTGYRIEHSTNGTTWTTASDNSSTSTSFRITGLADATTYFVRVAAKNVNGTSTYLSSSPTTYATFDRPTALSLTPVGGTVVANTLNSTNTNLTAQATIVAGRLTGGTATLYRGATAIATDTSIGASDTTVDFDLMSSTTTELQGLVASGGAMTVKVVDANGLETLASTGVTLTVDYTRPTVTIARTGTGVLNQGSSDTVTFTLSEASTNFVVGDVTTSGGSLSSFSGSGTTYTATFTASVGAAGSATISVLGSALTDSAGNGNTASSTFSIPLNSAPTLATPSTVTFTDTVATDTFTNATGTLSGADADSGDTLTYGIASVSGASATVSTTGTYGTLTVTQATGAYTFVPNNTAINARATNATETYTVTVNDGIQTTNATLTVSITAANDAPVMTTATSNFLDTAANDTFTVATGTFAASDADPPANTALTWGIQGGVTIANPGPLGWTTGNLNYDRKFVGTYGTLYLLASTGQFRFEPSKSTMNGLASGTSETFAVTVADSLNAVGTGSYIVSITAVNDRPIVTVTAANLPDVTAGLNASAYTIYHVTDSSGGSSPSSEQVARAFDDDQYTKYLNFSGPGSGVTIDLGSGNAYAVNGLGLTTANDASERDPTSYEIYGSNDGTSFALVSSGSLSPPTDRFTAYPNVSFTNSTNYRWYRVVFPTTRGGGMMQIAEIRLPAQSGDLLTYTEGAPAGVVLTGIDVTDADTSSLTGATVSITAGRTTGDVLSFTNDGSTMGSISGTYDAASGILTLSGTGTPAEYQAAFRAVRFRNTTNNPTATSSTRTVTWQVNDGDVTNATSTNVTSTITVIETVPSASSVAITSSAGTDNRYAIGDVIEVSATFTEVVMVTGSPRIAVNGLSGKFFTYSSGSGTNTLVFAYTVVQGDSAASGVGVSADTLALNGGTIKDSANASVTLTHSAVSNSTAHIVDGVLPTVSSFSTAKANGSYKAGEQITITATVSESVQAGASIDVTLDSGATLTLTSASAGTTLSGTYTVSAGENSADLTVSSFTINSVLDTAGNGMTSTALPTGSSNIAGVKAVVIDTIAPTILRMSVSADGSYKAGQSITVTATSSEAVRAGNTITVTFDTSETLTLAAASAGTTLSGTYTVAAGINTADLMVTSYTIDTVLDTAGNAMVSTTLPTGTDAIGPGTAVIIDTIAPTIVSFSSSTADGAYKAGQTINITATVSEPIKSGNSISVTLNSGATLTLSTTTTSTTLTGTYTVAAGNTASALNVTSFSIVSVLDGAGNAMTSTSVPGGANVADSSSIVVDTTKPTIVSFSTSTADGAYKAGQTIDLVATTSEPVLAGNSINVVLNSGSTVALTASTLGTTLTATYTIPSGDNAADLTVSSFTVVSVADPAGNALTSTSLPTGTNNIGGAKSIIVDTIAPTITAFSSAIATPTNLTTLTFTLSFSEAVTGIDATDFINAGTADDCVFDPGSDSGSTRTLTITQCGGGTVTPVFASGGAIDIAANSTQASAATSTSTINRRFLRSISFAVTSFAKTYGDDPFTVVASPSRGAGDGAVTYTVTAGTCSVGSSSGEVTITGAGSCTVSATVAEGTNNQTATTATQVTVSIAKKALTITASSHAVTYGDAAPTITPSYTPFVYNESPSDLTTPPICSSPYTVSSTALVNVATNCTGATTPNYEISYTAGTITIAKQPTAVTFTAATLSQVFNGTNRPVAATTAPANKNLVFTYVGQGHNSNTAPVNVGTYTVTATVDETNFIGTATTTLLITKANQTALTFANPSSVTFGSELQLVAVGGNGSGALSYSVKSGNCSVSATGMLTNTAAGSCVVSAARATSANYLATTSSDSTITVSKKDQSLAFTTTIPSNPVAGGTYAPKASATSGLEVSISITSGENTACSLANGVVTFIAAGSCVITGRQAGNANFNPADAATQTIAVGSMNQTISFTQPAEKRLGDPAFQLEASSSSGLPVSFSVAGTACSVSSTGLTTLLAPGTCDVTATSAADSKYGAAAAVTRTIVVRAGLPGVPHLMSASPSDSSIIVAYSIPPTDGGSPIVSYVVVATPTTGDPITRSDCSTTTLTCELVGLTNGMGYAVKVAAVTGAGVGDYSNETDPVTPFVAPEAVRDLTGVREEQSLLVAWDNPDSLGGGTLVRYDVSIREKDGSFGAPVQVAATNIRLASVGQRAWNHTFRNLSKAKVYEVKVVTVTSLSATSTPANTAQALVQRMNVAEAPRNLAIEATSETSAVATWATPLRDGGSPITSYSATSTNGTCAPASPTSLSCSMSNLTQGKAVTVTVKAVTAVGSSEVSTATISLPSRPAAPTIESVTRKGTSATITWKAPATDGGRSVTSYRINGVSTLDSKDAPQCSSTGFTCTVEGLAMSAAYIFTAKAFNSIGEGAASATYFAQAFSAIPAEWGSLSPTAGARIATGLPPAPGSVKVLSSSARRSNVIATAPKTSIPITHAIITVAGTKGRVVLRVKVAVNQANPQASITIPYSSRSVNVAVQFANAYGVSAMASNGWRPATQITRLTDAAPNVQRGVTSSKMVPIGTVIGSPVYFIGASSQLSAAAKSELSRIAAQVKRDGGIVNVTGYARYSPDTSRAFMKKVSEQRALVVANFLAGLGVQQWIRFQGVGAPTTKTGPDTDRRVVVSITPFD